MEYGLYARIDQFSDNRALQLQKVDSLNKSSNIINQNTKNNSLEEIQKESISKDKSVAEAKRLENKNNNLKYDYVLTNLDFGFDNDSKNFFVKSIRGKAENQYPTEQMMRLKSYMMHTAQNHSYIEES